MATKKKPPRQTVSEPSQETAQPAQAPADLPAAPEDSFSSGDETAKRGLPVVGIGASAGGLDAFKKFFTAMPADSGIAFVLIPHLDPTHESLMVELLAKYTAMPVVEAAEGMPVETNHVYIIPPNKYMTISDGALRLTGPVERRGLQTSIDFFLRSLAEDQQERAICIILSGTGSHGSLGLKAVKANGGMAMVQDPKTAEYDRMPQSALATDLADYVLPPEQMPEALIQYVQHFYVNGGPRAEVAQESPDQLKQVLALLRARTQYDFRCYRTKMLRRRIERRMGLIRIDQMPDYLARLREHPDELKHLAKDLLISVTSFFRDPEAFQVLETQVIAPVVQAKDPDAPLRVWVPGCATGEELYSIAMLLFEQLTAAQKSCNLQIFASDIGEDALEIARQGVYPESIVADVSPKRLGRFFTRLNDQSYQVTKQLREAVVFATQNLVSDAPFSKLDLISCRNLLIYLEAEVQKKVIALLHFALNEGGYLFLGPSETIGQQVDLFEPVSKKWRVYQRIGSSRPDRVEFPIIASGEQRRAGKRLTEPAEARPINFAELTQQVLLEDYAPAAVLINRAYEILYFYGPTMRYLDQPTGEPTQDLMRMAREGLRTKLRAMVHKAVRGQPQVVVSDVRVKRNGVYYPVKVTVKPVQAPKAAEGLLLVILQDEHEAVPPQVSGAEVAAEESLVRQLEYELKATREDLQSTIEEMESSHEELKVSNEEVMSMNEELQSANEELETSKEELQSLNEELITVNNQLQNKVEELEATNNNLANLLSSTDIATLCLDTGFRIKWFTPATMTLLNLIATDVGRPINDIADKFTDRDLLRDGECVLRNLTPIEKEVRTEEGHWYLRRILPYHTLEKKIEGVVVTFADVTPLKQAAERLRRLATVLLDSNDAVTVHDFEGRITAWNHSAERMYGYSEAEALQMNVDQIVPQELRSEARALVERQRRGESMDAWETSRVCKDGRILDVSLTATALKDEAGKPTAVATTERDVTERKQTERRVLEVAAEEQRRIGQDLHDGIGQELTGLSLMAQSLREALSDRSLPEAQTATKIAAGLQRALKDVHTLSRGLIPVDAEGLMAALTDLAARTSELHGMTCTFTCGEPVFVEDKNTATHLYHIAQEAVTNALKHSQARHVQISLRADDRLLTLQIQDDGVGMPQQHAEASGMGLRIMRHRARLIHATLNLGPAEGGGTVVTCSVIKGHSNDQ